MPTLILASQSPRRKQLLTEAGYRFEVIPADVDETPDPQMPAQAVPEALAQLKARTIADRHPGSVVIAADTLVILEGDILSKPADEAEAIAMLQRLSGKKHEVVTGVCICGEETTYSFSETTEVFFRPLSEEQIRYYVARFRPMDKAGSYAIQEWIGMIGISGIAGDYYNVMGLPASAVNEALTRHFPQVAASLATS